MKQGIFIVLVSVLLGSCVPVLIVQLDKYDAARPGYVLRTGRFQLTD